MEYIHIYTRAHIHTYREVVHCPDGQRGREYSPLHHDIQLGCKWRYDILQCDTMCWIRI